MSHYRNDVRKKTVSRCSVLYLGLIPLRLSILSHFEAWVESEGRQRWRSRVRGRAMGLITPLLGGSARSCLNRPQSAGGLGLITPAKVTPTSPQLLTTALFCSKFTERNEEGVKKNGDQERAGGSGQVRGRKANREVK